MIHDNALTYGIPEYVAACRFLRIKLPIFMHLQQTRMYINAQNAGNMHKCKKYSKYSTLYDVHPSFISHLLSLQKDEFA